MWKRNNFSRHRCEKLTELDSHRQDAIIFFSEENTKAIGVLHFVICNAFWLNYSLKLCPYDPPYLLFKTQICKNFNKSPVGFLNQDDMPPGNLGNGFWSL